MKKYYTDKFYEDTSKYSSKSARVIVPLILELIRPKKVIDVGCGTGEFLRVFKEKGIIDIFGVDGPWLNKERLHISEKSFKYANLEIPLKIDRTFDIAISLEVAEHLPEKSAETFVESLTNLAPVILFSAAIPFQGGDHHVNEQWPEYWAKLFNDRGYVPIDSIRKKIWNNNEVSFWYAQNLLLFVKKDYLKNNSAMKREFERTEGYALSIIHPKLYLHKAKRYDLITKIIPQPIRLLTVKLMNLIRQ